MSNPRTKKEYWNERARRGGSPEELVFASSFLKEYEANTRQFLSMFKDKKVLDVGCGYGRLSDLFNNYKGIDFSEEMVKLANERYPDKDITLGDTHVDNVDKYDVIFEAMCLSSFDMTPEQFRDKYKDKAKIIMCLEPNHFSIFYV